MIGRAATACLAAVAIVQAAPAAAQAYQCAIPKGITAPAVDRGGPPRRVPITGYTLALSWSPDYCRGREARRADALQCSGNNGRFGFVVHGLWPNGRSTYPQWCPTARRPTAATIARNMCISPSARLQARQWAKHGSCMTRRPDTYAKVTRILWRSLRLPVMDGLSRKDDLTAGDIRREFAAANPFWEADMVGIKLDRRGWVEELRLCYAKNFMPTRCDRRRLGPADATGVKIWRGLY